MVGSLSRVAVLGNPGNPPHVTYLRETERATSALGLAMQAFQVRGPNELPLEARAQQTTMPVVAYLSVGAPPAHLLAVFKQSLAEAGFVEGRNMAIETPSADGHYDRLPALAADLVRRQVAVIIAITANPALAAKEATATIPIVFNVPEDPVGLGLVASLARPGGNATGVSFLFSDLVAKHLGLLRELLPRAARIGLLVNPQNANADILTKNANPSAATNICAGF
jgi:ABC transporter substrate binding protein